MKDGIYFNLSDADYHALPRLSASGIKNLLISVPTFWARSWMNPDKDTDDTDTKAQILGRAYHCAFLEPDDLDARFVGEPDFSGINDLLTTDTQVKAALKDIGQSQTKAGENALERAYRLLDCGYDGQIKAILIDEFDQKLDGRQAINHVYWAQIQRDMERIKENVELWELLQGGASEVSILWTDPATGIEFKARIDKLKTRQIVDLKSFANPMGKQVRRCILDATNFNKYYLSMRFYQIAVDMIRALDLPINDSALMGHTDLIEQIKGHNLPHDAWLFFQEKSGVPNLLARKLRLHSYPEGVEEQAIGAEDHEIKKSRSAIAIKADMEIARGVELYRNAVEIYGTEQPWYPFDMISEITDDDFPNYFFDGMEIAG